MYLLENDINNENSKHTNKEDKKQKTYTTEKDIIMFFQSTIRNVILTTSVSFAALGYSRYYRGKNKLYSQGMVLVSILLLIISCVLNFYIYNTFKNYKNLEKYSAIKELGYINIIFIIIHLITLTFAIYTLYRVTVNKQFISQ